jgi:hypothetical protein
MPACLLTSQHRRGRAEVHLSGVFDGPAAWELVKRLDLERPDLLDFGRIDTFVDYGLAVLAHGLQQIHRPIALVGLRQHQLRMLRYLGVDVSDSGLVGAPEPLIPAALAAL